MPTLARTLFFGTLTWLAFGLLSLPLTETPAAAAADLATGNRVVFVGGGLSDEALTTLGSAVASCDNAVLLLDSKKGTPYLKSFLAGYRPDRVVPVGSFPDGIADLERRLDVHTTAPVAWTQGATDLWKTVFPRAQAVVVCPAEPRGQLLQAACLAGLVRGPLFVTHGTPGETTRLRKLLRQCGSQQVFLVGSDRKRAKAMTDVEVVKLLDEAAAASAYRRRLAKQGRIPALVAANPFDNAREMGGMAALAPWVALQKHAPLLLTDRAGTNVAALVDRALEHPSLRQADALLLVANLKAIPMQERPNPIPSDKEKVIEMEPLTPTGDQPFSFATGRLFHEDLAVVPLLLARQHLLEAGRGRREAIVASNPGNNLPLLETFSRNTVQELRNAGYETTAFFGKEVNAEKLRKQMTTSDLFLWEGHHGTLIRDFEFPTWDEPMRPALVFLQSCLALKEEKVQNLLSRGAIGVIGSSTRTYSGSGGACSLAFFDALLYENQTLGGSLRQAKNFLLAYAMLKQKRLGDKATRTGANLRSAWAFTLWGDPTVKLPRPEVPQSSVPAVRHIVTSKHIILTLPEEKLDKVTSGKFKTHILPNGREAGLVKGKDATTRTLVPFVFAEVHLPKARPGQTPKLHTKLPSRHWVFCWDERRRCGYLLVTPRAKDEKEIRFRVEWQPAATASTAPAAVGQ